MTRRNELHGHYQAKKDGQLQGLVYDYHISTDVLNGVRHSILCEVDAEATDLLGISNLF